MGKKKKAAGLPATKEEIVAVAISGGNLLGFIESKEGWLLLPAVFVEHYEGLGATVKCLKRSDFIREYPKALTRESETEDK